ncbi:hypothetical protein [Sandarakinorhabdus sp.]|uniref:hypothetical protein n=1 Tax=Sandarakinorhabdus sp. TaxID=1916663 RepID=UPI00286DC3ED|nr:hypothetical protein [Sandarakinorhabdus sp.]
MISLHTFSMAACAVGLGLALPVAAQAPAAQASAAPEVRQCLQLSALRSTNVVNSRAIDFTLRDGSVWRANLHSACPQLGTERAFSYSTSIGQLCAQDIITVIQPMARNFNGPRCGLAPFERQPAKPKKR